MRTPLALAVMAGLLMQLPSCSTEFHPTPCSVDDDCGSGLACVGLGSARTCDAPTSEPLRIGMSAPGSGPNIDLGVEMKRGVDLAFAAQNKLGGVRGRPLVLEFRDDEYEASLAEQTARDLLDVKTISGQVPRCPTTQKPPGNGEPVANEALNRGPGAVLAVLGNVGTPTMNRFAPIAVETGTIFFGAFTGAKAMLRDDLAGDCKRYIFNVRASYGQEAQATLEYFQLVGVAGYQHLMSFDQNDSFGDAGYNGLVAAYTKLIGPLDGTPGIARFRYTRNKSETVPAAASEAIAYLEGLLQQEGNHTVGTLMTDTYAPGNEFIKRLRTWQYEKPERVARLKLYFSNVSFVGPNSLAARLKEAGTIPGSDGVPFTEGVLVSQVVPNYDNDPSDIVREYLAAINAIGVAPTFTSLEGYISGKVFIGGLNAHRGEFSPDALLTTLEHLPNLNIGLGATSGFAPENHNYSRTVWGTTIQPDGRFKNLYYWSEGTSLKLFD